MTTLSFYQLHESVLNLTNEISELKDFLKRKQETPTEPEEKFLTIQEASEFLHLSVPTIYSKVSRRELPFMKRGKRLYFSNIQLQDFLKEGQHETEEETTSRINDEANAHLSKLK